MITALKVVAIVAVFAGVGFGVYKFEFDDGTPPTAAQAALFADKYAKMDASQHTWDTDVDFNMEEEDYVQIRPEGTQWSRYVERREMQHAVYRLRNPTQTTTLQSIRIFGDTAVIRTQAVFDAQQLGPYGWPVGSFHNDYETQDTWERVGNDWKLKISKDLKETITNS